MIELADVVSGGPGKDGIPSIDEPKFVPAENASDNVSPSTRGLFLESDSGDRFYPYNILVWHELVNDEIDGVPVAVTFCPLCGSAIVFERKVNDEVLEFGVSGLLYESNLLMYDRKTESLWSQIEGKALLGDYAATELALYPTQLLTFAEALEVSDGLQVLSENTGYERNYSFYPYGDYDETEELFSPVTYSDQRLPAKEIVYAVRVEGTPVAFVWDNLKGKGAVEFQLSSGEVLLAEVSDGEVAVRVRGEDEVLPGFFAQWFSWANHNLSEGVNADASGEVWVE